MLFLSYLLTLSPSHPLISSPSDLLSFFSFRYALCYLPFLPSVLIALFIDLKHIGARRYIETKKRVIQFDIESVVDQLNAIFITI